MEKHCLSKLNANQDQGEFVFGRKHIIKLDYTFQDESNLYLVLELCSRGELWELISCFGCTDQDLALWFIAQLILAVEFCHVNSIIHRDIKAENIFITANGDLRLADFGTAIDLKFPEVKVAGNVSCRGRGKRYENFVGTAQFMPPEALKNEPSTYATDLWSLGCTIYQILSGISPFLAPSDFYSYLIARKVDYEFPPNFPPLAIDLVQGLLKLDPNERLGVASLRNKQGLSDIKNHPYFKDIDFTKELLSENFFKNCRGLYPPLYQSCLQHMSHHWDIFREKWKLHNWLTEEGDLIEDQINDETIDEQEKRLYESCARPIDIFNHSLKLLKSDYGTKSSNLLQGKVRVLYLQKVKASNGFKTQDELDQLVKEFLAT